MINRQELIDVIHHALEGTDRFLVEVKVSADNVIEVLIDSMDSVTIDHCIALNDAVLSHFDRDVEDFELEVGSAGIGQPFKVLQQYINSIGYDVELLTADGKKMEGSLKSADEQGFVVTVLEKQHVEGKKRPQMVEVDKSLET